MKNQTQLPQFRPPSVPLVQHHPYFSVWSNSNHLAKDWTRHWTGAAHGITALVKVDGKTYRIIGGSDGEPAEQLSVEVWPTRTIYMFRCGDVNISAMFCTPLLCDDLDLLARPVTYLTFAATCSKAASPKVKIYIDASAQFAVESDPELVDTARLRCGKLSVLRASATHQKMLRRSGDNLRIEWGYFYLAADEQQSTSVLSRPEISRKQFIANGTIPQDDIPAVHCRANDGWPNLAFAFDLGKVGKKAVSRTMMFAFDEVFSIEYLHQKLRPYWRRDGANIATVLSDAAEQHDEVMKRCEAFDAKLVSDLTRAGGAKYAALCALAYRQAIAAHSLVAGPDGEPLFFSKENFSNGCAATVDVTYPSAPLFLLLQPKLLEGMLTPILRYASSPAWKFPFAPHDLGQYPLANGQIYGGGEHTEDDQMPVEECGNMLILMAALARVTSSIEYARKYWPLLTRWAEYLKHKGLDPDKQLCTDDFAGHLGHNANLSLKAIIALAGFAQMADKIGDRKTSSAYHKLAKDMARQWQTMAEDGDHTRLAFDQPNTWSQKYNLVWDELLGLKLFPAKVARREIAYYKTKLQKFGLPLDNRKTYTKLDWIVWSATMAEDPKDFSALVDPLFDWLDQTPTRVPMTDWYETTDGRQVGFQARSVVGGLFIKLLKDTMLAADK